METVVIVEPSRTMKLPINAVAVGGILCKHCSEVVPLNCMEDHAQRHLPQKYNAPQTKANKTNKIELSSIITDSGNSEIHDMDTRTLLFDDMPQPEEVRKMGVKLPQGEVSCLKDVAMTSFKQAFAKDDGSGDTNCSEIEFD